MNKKVFIGKHLRKMLEIRNMTETELAQKTGIFQQLISRYCNDITVPTATSLILMAMTLDCSVDFLITGKEYKSAQPEPPEGVKQDGET